MRQVLTGTPTVDRALSGVGSPTFRPHGLESVGEPTEPNLAGRTAYEGLGPTGDTGRCLTDKSWRVGTTATDYRGAAWLIKRANVPTQWWSA